MPRDSARRRPTQNEFDALPVVEPSDVVAGQYYCFTFRRGFISIPRRVTRSRDGKLRVNGFEIDRYEEIRGPVYNNH